MFILKAIFQQQLFDDSAPIGGEVEANSPAVLDENAATEQSTNDNSAPSMNVEQFIANFEGDEKARAQKYANNYLDESGNLNVTNMIKSGFNLESKFGAFTGAPDSYEIPTPEYLDGDVNAEDPYLQEFMGLAKDSNMSQESFEKFMDIHLRASIAPPVDVDALSKEIGPEFNAMRSNMAGFLKSRLDDDGFKAIQGLINSKESFLAVNALIKATKPTKMDTKVQDSFNHAELNDQMKAEFDAKDANGSPRMRDPIYAKSWRERWSPHIGESEI